MIGLLLWWAAGGLRELDRGDSSENSGADATITAASAQAEFAAYAGSDSCRECHAELFDSWWHSHHRLAERAIDPARDDVAFDPGQIIDHGSQTSMVGKWDEELATGDTGTAYVVETLGIDGQVAPHIVKRAIGEKPLRQFIVDAPQAQAEPVAPGAGAADVGRTSSPSYSPTAPRGIGRQQVLELAYDPAKNEWFNVYGDENRRPGEWGHWTGRGMNWNSQCAACHNTRVRKNYDPAADAYATTMAEAAVSCEACHGPMKDHVEWQRDHGRPPDSPSPAPPAPRPSPDPTLRKFTSAQWLAVCGSCHSRRGELTGDFVPGESYFDHYALTIPDLSEIFYADGQVHEEDYEFTSFLSSRMYASGVTCMHCHDPHRARPLAEGNALCMKCHNGSFPRSPRIDPATHTFHAADSTGSQCVNCHMPQTVYMQRHPRHDHGFTIPDPLLTKQHGIPNACNRCHSDQNADWALAAVEKWYGERMDRPTRRRAQTIAAARRGEVDKARGPLLAMLADEENVFWQASAATLLPQRGLLDHQDVQQALIAATGHKFPLVREKAAAAIAPLVEAGHAPAIAALGELLDDPSRSVRVAAGWALRADLDQNSPAGKDMLAFLRHNHDQPGGAMQQGMWNLARNDVTAAVTWFQRSVEWDPNSAPFRDALAVGYSTQSRPADAVRELQAAVRIAPDDAEYRYKLGLAWAETENVNEAIAALKKAVELDASHARAWYNLGLALDQTGDPVAAVRALIAAEKADPRQADIPFALATIYANLGRADDARAAARRTLAINPSYVPARQLLQGLDRRN